LAAVVVVALNVAAGVSRQKKAEGANAYHEPHTLNSDDDVFLVPRVAIVNILR
jgi:hypothetical protein